MNTLERKTEFLRSGGTASCGIALRGAFLAVALLLLLLPGLLFRAQTPQPIEKHSGKHRVNVLVREDDPAFRSLKALFSPLTDPEEFIRGGEKTGYSSFFRFAFDAAAETPVLKLFPLVRPSAGTPVETIPGTLSSVRVYSDWTPFPLLSAEKTSVSANPGSAATPDYPLWLDQSGKKLAWAVTSEEERMTPQFRSRDVTGPTCLLVEEPPAAGLPPDSILIQSCGSVSLDLYAKQKFDTFLQALPPAPARPWKAGEIVRIFWRKNAPVQTPGPVLKGLFPEESCPAPGAGESGGRP